jgi:hypothetical protein
MDETIVPIRHLRSGRNVRCYRRWHRGAWVWGPTVYVGPRGHAPASRDSEHPFGTMKARMGATHFLCRTLPKVATEMALSVLAHNLTRVMNIMGIKPMMAAMRA